MNCLHLGRSLGRAQVCCMAVLGCVTSVFHVHAPSSDRGAAPALTPGQPGLTGVSVDKQRNRQRQAESGTNTDSSMSSIKFFLCGDVMLARGIDMILGHSCDPTLYESNGLDAYDYVKLAVNRNGPLPSKEKRGVEYVWGDAIEVMDNKKVDLRIINLENSVTTSDSPWPRKGIHYRMHPKNVDVIRAAKINCCVLSNNHTADWGFEGLEETIATMKEAQIPFAGAGLNEKEAAAPAVFEVPGKGRVLVFAGGHSSSGIPIKWRALAAQSGVNILDIEFSKSVSRLRDQIKAVKKPGDIVVLSIHWGGNWGFQIDPRFPDFAHDAIDHAGVDLVHGHSSHHAMGMEVYQGKLIIYGCGDFINDYEGITGYEEFRGDLSLMYFPSIDPNTGQLTALEMVPTQIKWLRVNLAKDEDCAWMEETLKRESKKLGLKVRREGNEIHAVL